MILLDTHIWLWWLTGNGPLSTDMRSRLDYLAAGKDLCLSWVSVWETETLVRKGRISLKPSFSEWILKATDDRFIKMIGVDIELIIAQRLLSEHFHHDPADKLITTTAKILDIPLATLDSRIIESKEVEIWN